MGKCKYVALYKNKAFTLFLGVLSRPDRYHSTIGGHPHPHCTLPGRRVCGVGFPTLTPPDVPFRSSSLLVSIEEGFSCIFNRKRVCVVTGGQIWQMSGPVLMGVFDVCVHGGSYLSKLFLVIPDCYNMLAATLSADNMACNAWSWHFTSVLWEWGSRGVQK